MACLAALLTFALTTSAGVWQWRKAHTKQAAQAEMAARRHAKPWANGDWPCGEGSGRPFEPSHQPVRLRGHWLTDRTVLLDNRPMDGMSGFIVVTPLQLSPSGSSCDGRVVLVARGWLPRDPASRLRTPAFATPPGEVEVPGTTVAGVPRVYELAKEPMPPSGSSLPVRQNADVAFWSAWGGVHPLPGAVLQSTSETVSDGAAASAGTDPLLRHWPEPGQGGERNMAYAVQWFAMSALIAGLAIWFQVIRPARQGSFHVPS